MSLPQQGVLRVVPPAQLEAQLKAADEAHAQANAASATPQALSSLAGYIRSQFEMMKAHRNNAVAGWSERLLIALRTVNGAYDATKLAQIRQFGGSEVYARVVAMKCRGATALLRDVYLAPDRPWGLDAPDDPAIPDNIMASIKTLVQAELSSLPGQGSTDPNTIRDRVDQLTMAARDAAKVKAEKQAKVAEDKINDILESGGFYKAIAEFLVDLPQFPFACIKGPVVKIVPLVTWKGGTATIEQKPKLFWQRVNPFDIWWTPGASDIEDASTIERSRVTRGDLNDLLDLPTYNEQEVRAVLDEYGRGGIADNWDTTDAERATLESRENPNFNRSGMINMLEWNGNIQGRMLVEYGMDKSKIPDDLRDYFVQAWLIGNHVIKVQFSPSPRKRHPYYITSFEKTPGSPVGNGLPDILGDIQEVANATVRSLVNNLSIASGPQVVLAVDRMAADEDGEALYPWKRWRMKSDPLGGSSAQVPVSFFQPTSNAQELIAVYQYFVGMADELSGIPKYMSGSGPGGGAGRTSSGLAMLMGNASKLLQTVCANVDRDVVRGILQGLFDMLMLTDTSGLLTGEENIRIMGVNVAVQKETQRSRQLELLQISANPIDMQIMGPRGRATLLRAVSTGVGLDGEKIVPSDDQLDAMQQAHQAAPPSPDAAAQAQGGQSSPSTTGDMGPRYNANQQRPAMAIAGQH